MIQQQQTLVVSPYIELYNLVVPKDNMLRQINELVDFSFVGDTAYSEKDNIVYASKNDIELVAKLNPLITQGGRKKEEEFQFNKDAGMYARPVIWRFGKRAQEKRESIKTKRIPTISM